MAENAVHITSVEHVKPTIFELIAQESLLGTLQPSFSLLCQVFRNRYKEKFGWFFKNQDEWYLFLNFLLQSHYMRLFKGSFSEAFYGLSRVVCNNNKSTKLSKYSQKMSIFCLAGLPYLSLKIKRTIESLQLEQEAYDISPEKKKRNLQIIFAYKSINALYEIAKLYFFISYISGYSEQHTPLLKLSGVKLVYHNVHVPSWRELITTFFTNKKRFSAVILPITIKLFSQFLEISAFTVQFLNWWHSDEVRTNLNILPIPPPLQVESNNKMLCPICKQKRKVEVVLQTSGYVYCYRCINEELQKSGKCPVTNFPASSEHLIRIYTDK